MKQQKKNERQHSNMHRMPYMVKLTTIRLMRCGGDELYIPIWNRFFYHISLNSRAVHIYFQKLQALGYH